MTAFTLNRLAVLHALEQVHDATTSMPGFLYGRETLTTVLITAVRREGGTWVDVEYLLSLPLPELGFLRYGAAVTAWTAAGGRSPIYAWNAGVAA